MAAKGVADTPASTGINAGIPAKPTATATITPPPPTTEATTNTPVKQPRKKKNPQERKGKATSTKDEARLRERNRFVIPGHDSDNVGDPDDLSPNIMGESEKLITAFEDGVLASMPTCQEIYQLSQESQTPADIVYEDERKNAEAIELALSEMDEAFPALPDGILDVEMPAAAGTEGTIPTTSLPPPAVPSFADRVSTSSSFFLRENHALCVYRGS